MTDPRVRLSIRQRVKEMIAGELSFTNGWAVPERRYDELCDSVAVKILAYLRRQGRVARQHKCERTKR